MERLHIQDPIVAYKLMRIRKNGTLGSLFIKRKAIIPVGIWMESEDIKTPGYAHRPGWHVTRSPNAPHLKMNGRIWVKMMVKDFVELIRPEAQGGVWWLAKWLKILPQ